MTPWRTSSAHKFDLAQSSQKNYNSAQFVRARGVSILALANANSIRPKQSRSELSALSRERMSSSEFRYRNGTEIYGEAEPAEFIYQIVEGAVRSYKLLSDGRRQIGGFHLAGDIFGVENGNVHRFTAEAIVDTTVRLFRRRGLDDIAEGDVSVTHDLLYLTTKNLQHVENHMLLLGARTRRKRSLCSCSKWTVA